MAEIIDAVKKEGISGVFVENTTNPKLVSQIARETGATVGGTLYSDALAASGEPAASYLGMMTWNAGQLIYVLKGEQSKGLRAGWLALAAGARGGLVVGLGQMLDIQKGVDLSG